MAASDPQCYLENLRDEVDGAALYHALAGVETDASLSGIYGRLAEAEERHADLWRAKLREAGKSVPSPRPSWRTRVLVALARRFGPGLVLPTIAGREEADSRPRSNRTHASSEQSRRKGIAVSEAM